MGLGGVHSAAAAGGMADVGARIAAIQGRISGLTGPRVGQVPIVDAPGAAPAGTPGAGPPPATFDLAAATAVTTAPPAPAAPVTPAGAPTAAPASGAPPVTTSSDAGAALAAKLPAHGKPWAQAIADAALRVGVDPSLLAALVQHESDFNPRAVSRAGALGLAQLMPDTARGLGVDPHDPAENLAGGARFLRAQLDRFGSVDLALAAYNAGPTRVAQAGGVPRIAETTAYVARVTATWEKLR